MPMPRLTTPPERQLERGAARDDLALVERHRHLRAERGARLARERRAVGASRRSACGRRRLATTTQSTRPRGSRPAADSASRSRRCAPPARSRSRRQFFAAMAIARQSSVSASRSIVTLPASSAVVPRKQRDVDREGLVEQPLLAVDRMHAHEILGGARVDLAAAVARIDEGAEADLREHAGPLRGDVAEELRDRRRAGGCTPRSARPPRAPRASARATSGRRSRAAPALRARAG